MDEVETADIYEVVTARHRTGSMVVTSNRDPSEWLAQLADPLLLAQALVDRFSTNAYDLVIEASPTGGSRSHCCRPSRADGRNSHVGSDGIDHYPLRVVWRSRSNGGPAVVVPG